MTFDELNENQLIDLRQSLLVARSERGESDHWPSYYEFATCEDFVSMDDLSAEYGGVTFTEEDFTPGPPW